MASKGRSEIGIFGDITHYDAKGRKVGRSEPGVFGDYTNYDAKGKKVGRSEIGMFGDVTHYDSRGRKTGRSEPGVFGDVTHYDSRGRKIGRSKPGALGVYNHTDGQGCYVATCVYGSYDCAEVWTLRRFRDEIIGVRIPGRVFIRLYYAVSPTVVRLFGEYKGFRAFWRRRLDALVARLRQMGVEDTPYSDRDWRKS